MAAISARTAASALMRRSAMRRSTPRTRREPDSICSQASNSSHSSPATPSPCCAALDLSLRTCLTAAARACAKRSCSAATPAGRMSYSGVGSVPASDRKARPTAMPGDTASPVKLRSGRLLDGPASIFIELRLDQRFERVECRLCVGAGGAQLDDGAGGGGEHHEPHDGTAGDFLAAALLIGGFDAQHRDGGSEPLNGLDEL